MPSGRLGALAVPANANTKVYTVPLLKVATMNIRVVNRSEVEVTANVAVAPADTPVAADYIEYQVKIPRGGVLENTGIVAGANERVIVHVSDVCTVRVHGFEESA